MHRFDYPTDVAQQDVADLTHLPLQTISSAALANDALALAIEHDSTAYDSAYVALAQRLSLPLVTADQVLVHRFQGSALDVRFLGDWP